MSRVGRVLFVGAACLVYQGCGEGRVDASAPAVRDSAGVRIVVADEGAQQLSLAERPELQIGASSGNPDQELFRATSAFRVSDGRVFVANSGTQEVRVYDPSGRLIDRFGSSGEGPGEFVALDWMTQLGADSLAVLDIDLQRVTALTMQGDLLWTRNVSVPLALPWAGDFYSRSGEIFLLWDSGDVFDQIASGAVAIGETARNTAVLYHYPADGSEPQRVVELPGPEAAVIESSSGGPATTGPPLGRQVTYTVQADRIYLGNQSGPDLRVLDTDGQLVGLVRLPVDDLSVTEADIADYEQVVLSRFGDDPERRAAVQQRIQGLPVAPQKPAYGQAMVDAAGRLWVSGWHHVFEPPDRWSIVDLESGSRSVLEVPPDFEVLWADQEWVLGKWVDELGVEYIQLYAYQEVP